MSLSGTKKAILLGSGIVVFLLILMISARVIHNQIFGDEYRRLEAVTVGMSEREVIALLGQPHKTYYRDSAPKDYYVPGYTYKERAISNKVFIYSFSEPIAYYYLDNNNKVEDAFVGGS